MGKFRKAKYGDYVSCTQFESRQGRKVDMDRLGKCVLEYSKSVFLAREPWSSGYRRRFTIRRS